MAKQNGLAARLFASGYDLSADVSVIQQLGYEQTLLAVPTLAKEAMERVAGVADGRLTVNGWFDPDSAHAVWTANSGKLPTADVIALAGFGAALGDPMAGLVAKQASYEVNRQPGNALATVAAYQANGYGLEFGRLLTTGPKQTDASAADSSSIDDAADSADGGAGYLQIITLGSGTPTVKIQESSDNGATDTWADLVTFTVQAAHTAERIEVAGAVERYLRVVSTGTFTNLVFVAGFARY